MSDNDLGLGSTGYSDNNSQMQSSNSPNTGSTWDTIKVFIFPILGIVVLVMCFMAANSISNGGAQIMRITSQGGRTLEEAYYRQLGGIYSGYANVVRAIGISLASFLVWLGLKK